MIRKAQEVDALLPQTQCGLCGYAGCMPYAEALANGNAAINLCPPGGVPTLVALARYLQKDATPFIAEMEKKSKPTRIAIIRESECIGCAKCISACPVDAILGGAKVMHTVIADECTGCELCIPACPVDCIDLIVSPETTLAINKTKADHARMRFNRRNERLARAKDDDAGDVIVEDKVDYVKAAIFRAKAKNQTL